MVAKRSNSDRRYHPCRFPEANRTSDCCVSDAMWVAVNVNAGSRQQHDLHVARGISPRFVMNNRLTAAYWAAQRGLRDRQMLERSKMAAPKARPGFYDDRFRNRLRFPHYLPFDRCPLPETNHDRFSRIDVRCVPTNPDPMQHIYDLAFRSRATLTFFLTPTLINYPYLYIYICVCIYACVYIHTYIHTYIHICTYTTMHLRWNVACLFCLFPF